MIPLAENENIQGYVYIFGEGDTKNIIYLTNQRLVIFRNGKSQEFELARLKGLVVQQRQMVGAIVLGGIAVCLSLIAIFTNQLNYQPLILLFVLFFGTLAFYYGYSGAQVLTIWEDKFTYDFSLPFYSENLKAFLQFTHHYIYSQQGKSEGMARDGYFIYLPVLLEEWESIANKDDLHPLEYKQKGFSIASPLESLNKIFPKNSERRWTILKIDPLQMNAEVKYTLDPDSDLLLPHIYGPVNNEAIVEAIKPESLNIGK